MCYIIYFTKTKSNKKTKNMFKFIKQILPGIVMMVALVGIVGFANSVPAFAQLVPGTKDICTDGNGCPVTGSNDFSGTTQSGLLGFIINIARFLTYFGVGLSVLFMVWGGIRYITSNGNEDTAGNAKQVIINATIGLIISIVAFTIVNIVAGIVSGTTGADIIQSTGYLLN
jgi:hypothetical protein